MDNSSTREKILLTALKIISTEGTDRLTIRRIAQECDVNIAAINYHFRSKENLIIEALSLFGQKINQSFSLLDDSNLPHRERLFLFLDRFSQQIIEYPGFMKSQIDLILAGKDMVPHAVQNMRNGREKLLGVLKALKPDYSEEELSMKLFQMMSGLILPIFFGKYVNEIYDFNISEDAERRKFIRLAMETFL